MAPETLYVYLFSKFICFLIIYSFSLPPTPPTSHRLAMKTLRWQFAFNLWMISSSFCRASFVIQKEIIKKIKKFSCYSLHYQRNSFHFDKEEHFNLRVSEAQIGAEKSPNGIFCYLRRAKTQQNRLTVPILDEELKIENSHGLWSIWCSRNHSRC